MSISLARQIAVALNVRSESRIRSLNEALLAYVRLTQQSPTTEQVGSIDASQVISGTFADARIAESNVTQHEAALELSALQVSSGSFADARIQQSNVTQHQAALSIAETQVPDGALLARVGSDETIAGDWLFDGELGLRGIEAADITAAAHDYALANDVAILEVTLSSGNQNMTGIANGYSGRILVLINVDATGQLTLVHNSVNSAGANRFFLPGNANLGLTARSGLILLKVGASLRWHVIGNAIT